MLNYKNKKLSIVLAKVYGLNKNQIKYVFNNIGLNPNIMTYNVSTILLKQINNLITNTSLINKELQYKTKNNLKLKILTNTYKGTRLTKHLPLHGQNTHSNGKTAKQLNK